MRETRVQSLGREDPLEKGMATHSSILACRIPWTEEPGGLQSILMDIDIRLVIAKREGGRERDRLGVWGW